MKGVIQNKILAIQIGPYFTVAFSSLVKDEATARILADALTQLATTYAPDNAQAESLIDKWDTNTPKSVN